MIERLSFLSTLSLIVFFVVLFLLGMIEDRNARIARQRTPWDYKRREFLSAAFCLPILGSIGIAGLLVEQAKEEAIIDLLAREGVWTTATVVELHGPQSKDRTCWVYYTFEVSNSGSSRPIEVHSEVSKSLYETLKVGDTIPVIYSPTQPNVARPRDGSMTLTASRSARNLAIFVALLCAVGVLYFLYKYWTYW